MTLEWLWPHCVTFNIVELLTATKPRTILIPWDSMKSKNSFVTYLLIDI